MAFAYDKVVQHVWQERFITYVSITAPLDREVVDALCALPHVESIGICPRQTTQEERDLQAREYIVNATDKAPPGAIERIVNHSQITALALDRWILSDEDCRAIGRHAKLQTVVVGGCHLSERGLAHLLSAPRLREFNISYSKVSGTQLDSLAGSRTLETVNCNYAPVRPEFAAYLGRCPNIGRLEACGTQVDDRFVAQLGFHPTLTDLAMYVSSVSDASVPALMEMPALQSVSLPRSTVSLQAVQQLKMQKPQLKVIHY
jgi:hypothetical protein